MKKDLPELFNRMTHGVYVVGVSAKGSDNAFTAAWIMQASFNPLLLALSIDPEHTSYDILKQGEVFTVNVLPESRLDLVKQFSQPASSDKLDESAWHRGDTGAPILKEALAFFECEFSHECEAGDHRIVIGRVVAGEIMDPNAVPMNYRETGAIDESAELYPKDFKWTEVVKRH